MKTIIEMAREVGIDAEKDTLCRYEGWVEPLTRFAALVIANHPPQSYMTWQEGYEAGKQAALQKALANEALDKMAENARELGLDYEPRAWFTVDELNAWADKKLKENPQWAEQPAQHEPVALVEKFSLLLWDYQELERAFEKATGGKWVRKSNTPQRTWVGLTDEEIAQGCKESWVTEQAWQSAVWWAEAKLKEKNT